MCVALTLTVNIKTFQEEFGVGPTLETTPRNNCLFNHSAAPDDHPCVDFVGRRIFTKKTTRVTGTAEYR